MRRILVGLLLGFLFLAFAPYGSYADMCVCKSKMGEDIPVMRGMGHRGMGMVGAEQRIWRNLRGLGLDEEQKEEIREIKSRVTKDTIRMGADLRIARMELRDILDKDPVDMNAAEAKLKQISSMRTDIHLSQIKALEEVKAKLTPEQKEKFKINMRKHRRWAHGATGMTRPCDQREKRAPAMKHGDF